MSRRLRRRALRVWMSSLGIVGSAPAAVMPAAAISVQLVAGLG